MNPHAIAVNSVTNKIYVSNQVPLSSNTVTVMDGATLGTTTVPVGIYVGYFAVNSVTNQIYVTNVSSNTVTVIDGSTNATTTVSVGTNPNAIAVNPVTNNVYTANFTSNDVTVIDGAANTTTTVPVGTGPCAIVANIVTNKIYVANTGSNDVTVIDGATNATTTVPVGDAPAFFATAVNPVTNMVYVANQGGDSVTVIAQSMPTPPTGGIGSSARLINISTRAEVGTGGNILIPGFVIGGSGAETLLIRADGPALAQFSVEGVLAQPSLSVFDSLGNLIVSNTGWINNPSPALIASTAASVGAFALTPSSADCALIASLPAGAYTVQVSGVGSTSGVALAEVYEVSSSGTRLVNISTRGQVGTGANIIIPGFVIAGSGNEKLLVRADGPGLTEFGVGGVLAEPSLSVFNSSGSVIASNMGWESSSNPALIAITAVAVGAFALISGSADSAQIVDLPAGAYTMHVSGIDNTTGVALAEVYEVP
jgi:YVTN family beta-propeller protein